MLMVYSNCLRAELVIFMDCGIMLSLSQVSLMSAWLIGIFQTHHKFTCCFNQSGTTPVTSGFQFSKHDISCLGASVKNTGTGI